MMTTLTRYRDWAPTGHDCKGLLLPDRQNWLVCPVSHNRDSRLLDESNWAAQLAALGEEGDTLEIHRFNHWACGWFEIVLLDPSREDEAQALADRLENYPILNEGDHSSREYAATLENIAEAGRRFLADGAPDGWPGEVYHWLAGNGHDGELESRDDQGGYPADKPLKEALAALGWLDADEE